jgi:hypothetical protein
MNERGNYSGHFSGPSVSSHAQGIVFRLAGKISRFSPYMWLNYVDIEAGRQIKLDFGRYDVVIRGSESYYLELDKIFEAITRHECSEIAEGELSIEIIEKEEAAAPI